MHRRRALIDIIGVHHECVRQLAGRTGELAENEDALLIVPCRDEFLGDQIHPVVKAADDAQIGAAVMHHHILYIMMLNQEMNRPVGLGAEPGIDAIGQRHYLLLEQRIFLDLRAARRGNLDKRKPSNPLGLQLQESFGGQKPFKDALRVVRRSIPNATR